jgi:hypothetical protein
MINHYKCLVYDLDVVFILGSLADLNGILETYEAETQTEDNPDGSVCVVSGIMVC